MEPTTPILIEKKDIRSLPISFGLFTLLFWILLEGASALPLAGIWLFFVLATALYLRASGTYQRTAVTTFFFLGAVIFTPILPLTDWGTLQLVVFLLQMGSLLLWIAFSLGHGGSQSRLADLLVALVALCTASMEGIFVYGEDLASHRTIQKSQKQKKTSAKRPFPWGIVVGFLLSLPVLCFLIPLLAGADAAFEGMINGWDEALGKLIEKLFDGMDDLILSLILAAIIFYPTCAVLYSLSRKPGKDTSADAPILPGSMLIGFYGSITLICLIYLFSQLSYLFSGFMGTLPLEMTAAEYARRGFFEIFAISILMLIVIGVGVLLAKKDGFHKLLTVLICFLSAFDLLLIATALAKMILYMRLYGLTVKRLTVSATLILLAVIFVTILLRRLFSKFRSLPVVLAAALILFGIPSFADPHRVVAEYNVWAWEKGYLSAIDTELFYDLSDAAIPALIRVYESENAEASNRANTVLRTIYTQRCSEYDIPYGSPLPTNLTMEDYSVSRQIAHHAINEICQSWIAPAYGGNQ